MKKMRYPPFEGENLYSCAIWHQPPMGRYGGVVGRPLKWSNIGRPLKSSRFSCRTYNVIIRGLHGGEGGCDLETPFEEGWLAPPPSCTKYPLHKREAERICNLFAAKQHGILTTACVWFAKEPFHWAILWNTFSAGAIPLTRACG